MSTDTPPDAPVVVFDLDDTLVRGESFGAYLRWRVRRSPLPLALLVATSPVLAVLRLLGRWPGLFQVGAAAVCLAGCDAERYAAEVARFAPRHAAAPGVAIADGLARLREHLARGDAVVIATACEERLAGALAAELGLAGVPLVGSRAQFGRWGPTSVRRAHGPGKVRALAAAGVRPPWRVAYTDSDVDVPLLRGAHRPVLVGAPPRLAARVRAALGRPVEVVDWA